MKKIINWVLAATLTFGGSTGGILEVLQSIIVGNCSANMQLTLIDDLTTTLKVNNSAEVMGLISAMSDARRKYADQQIPPCASSPPRSAWTTGQCQP